MKTIFMIIVTSFSIVAQAQKECQVKLDPISNVKMIETWYWQNNTGYTYQEGNYLRHFIVFQYNGEKNIAFEKDSEVIYKLEDGTILRLKCNAQIAPDSRLRSAGDKMMVDTYYKFTFEITEDQLKKLAQSKVIFMRWPNPDGGTSDRESRFMKKLAKKIQDGALCVLQNM